MTTVDEWLGGRIQLMFASESLRSFWSSDWVEVAGPFAVLALIILLAALWYAREGRNSVLEHTVKAGAFRSPVDFRGSLVVEHSQPGSYLRLCTSTPAASRLHFLYRWIIGWGRQAKFDEVIFDGGKGLVELKTRNRQRTARFSEFMAIRMREVAGGRSAGSVWHVELISHKGKATPFVTSEWGDRRMTFESTAPVAKAASEIMAVPVQVRVAGNVWTPGWPPKNPMATS